MNNWRYQRLIFSLLKVCLDDESFGSESDFSGFFSFLSEVSVILKWQSFKKVVYFLFKYKNNDEYMRFDMGLKVC